MLNYSIDYINMQLHLLCFVCRGSISFEGPDRKGISVISQNQGNITLINVNFKLAENGSKLKQRVKDIC